MNIKKEIKINNNEQSISVEIRSIENTFGSFAFSFYDKGIFKEAYRGKFGDPIPDIFTLPYKATYLSGHRLTMIGNFSPDPSISKDIKFQINFIQEGIVVDTIEVDLKNKEAETIEILIKISYKQ